MEQPRITIFITYSHDSDTHKARVLELSNALRENGLDCQIDAYEPFPVQGWPIWMLKKLKESEFVLVVCTETYRRRFEGDEPDGIGTGAKFEGVVVAQTIYEAEFRNRRFVPVVVAESDVKHIPTVLQPFTRFDVSTRAGFESLYSLLTGQPAVVPPPVGQIRKPHVEPRETTKGSATSELNAGATEGETSPRRLVGELSIQADALGLMLVLEVANTAAFPLFIENPVVLFAPVGGFINLTKMPSGPQIHETSSQIEMLPTRPVGGPIQPTERRSYFVPHSHTPFLASEHQRMGGGPVAVVVRSGAGEEFRVERGVAEAIRQLGPNEAVRSGQPPTAARSSDTTEAADPLPADRMQIILSLLTKRFTTESHNPFSVYPPRVLLERPDLAASDEVVVRLSNERFVTKFKDGTSVRLSLLELMVVTHQLIFAARQVRDFAQTLSQAGGSPALLQLNTNIDVHGIMKPEMVKVLLSKIEFSNTASEDIVAG